MKIIVGWWNPANGALVDIPGFDHVHDPYGWIPAIVEIQPERLNSAMNGSRPLDAPLPVIEPATIRSRREELGLSKVRAAKLAGVSRTTWTELEAGLRTGAHASTWKAIARVLEL